MVVVSLGRVLAVSPHLDDAVLSVGGLLAAHPGSVALTVFAGFPARYEGLGAWDADCGFAEGDDIVAARRAEDLRAVESLGAEASWLDFVEIQYEPSRPAVDDIARAIGDAARAFDIDTIAMPLGLRHPDHERAHQACLMLFERDPGLIENWVAWADIPYRARHPELLDDRVKSLRSKGFGLDPWSLATDERKQAAVAEYASQLRALGDITDAELPEQLYALRRPVAARQ